MDGYANGNMNVKIIAIVAVIAVVAAGGACVYFLTMNNGEKPIAVSDLADCRLLVYGNANNDDVINNDDVRLIEKLIADKSEDWSTKYPFADVNNDKTLDSADLDMAKKILNRDSMEINVAYKNGDSFEADKVKYPIKHAIVVGDNPSIAVKTVGALDRIVGIAVTELTTDPIYSDLTDESKITRVGNKSTAATISLISNVHEKYNDVVVLTSSSSRYLTNEADIEAAGVPVVRFNVDGGTSGLESIQGILTVGFLLECEEKSQKFAKFCDDILKNVADKVGAKVKTKETCIATNRTKNVSGLSSEYYPIVNLAGGNNVITKDTTQTSFNGATDDWLLAYEFKHIVHSTSLGYATTLDEKSEYDTYAANFKNLQQYKDKHFVLVNANLPAAIRVAYIASYFYPDLFDADYGDKMLKTFFNDYLSNMKSYNIADGTFMVKYTDVYA